MGELTLPPDIRDNSDRLGCFPVRYQRPHDAGSVPWVPRLRTISNFKSHHLEPRLARAWAACNTSTSDLLQTQIFFLRTPTCTQTPWQGCDWGETATIARSRLPRAGCPRHPPASKWSYLVLDWVYEARQNPDQMSYGIQATNPLSSRIKDH